MCVVVVVGMCCVVFVVWCKLLCVLLILCGLCGYWVGW